MNPLAHDRASTPDDAHAPFAAVILAGRASGADRNVVGELVLSARAAGAEAIVVVVPRGWRAPAFSRVVHVAPGASTITAIRSGMAQLSNTPARYALLWPLEAASVDADTLSTLVTETMLARPPFAAMEGDDPDHAPVMIARDAWLDVMTLGEQGMAAAAARRGITRIARMRPT